MKKQFFAIGIMLGGLFLLQISEASEACSRCAEIDRLAIKFQALSVQKVSDQKAAFALLDETDKYFDPLEKKDTQLSAAEFRSLIFLAMEANLFDPETEVAEVVAKFIYRSRDTQIAWTRLKETLTEDCKWQAFASSVLEHRCGSRGDVPKEQAKLDRLPECKKRKFVDYRACIKKSK